MKASANIIYFNVKHMTGYENNSLSCSNKPETSKLRNCSTRHGQRGLREGRTHSYNGYAEAQGEQQSTADGITLVRQLDRVIVAEEASFEGDNF